MATAIDPKYFRPAEVDLLIGDPSKAKEKLGREPMYNLQALCSEMVAADVELFKRGQVLRLKMSLSRFIMELHREVQRKNSMQLHRNNNYDPEKSHVYTTTRLKSYPLSVSVLKNPALQ